MDNFVLSTFALRIRVTVLQTMIQYSKFYLGQLIQTPTAFVSISSLELLHLVKSYWLLVLSKINIKR